MMYLDELIINDVDFFWSLYTIYYPSDRAYALDEAEPEMQLALEYYGSRIPAVQRLLLKGYTVIGCHTNPWDFVDHADIPSFVLWIGRGKTIKMDLEIKLDDGYHY